MLFRSRRRVDIVLVAERRKVTLSGSHSTLALAKSDQNGLGQEFSRQRWRELLIVFIRSQFYYAERNQ